MKHIRHFIIVCGCLIMSHAQAALNLELSQGVHSAMHISLKPFENDPSLKSGETFTQVIQNDLNHSGQFIVKKSSTTQAKPGSDATIAGSVTPAAGNQYQIHITLDNQFAHDNLSPQRVLAKNFTVPSGQLRSLAHHVSDLIYEKLTGVRGVFSTHLAYVLKLDKSNQPPYALMVSDADGHRPQALLRSYSPIMSPTWSPDGKSLYYVSFEKHRAQIFHQVIRSGKRTVVSGFPGINNAPAISPDGQHMALVLSQTGYLKIYEMNLKNHQLKALTHGQSIDTEPSYSPDGKYILFTSDRGGSPQIYRYDFSSQQIQRLTFDGSYSARARVFPNNQGFIMMHKQNGWFGIAKQSLQDHQLQMLTQAGSNESPSLAPNGQMIIYASKQGRRGVLSMVSIDGQVHIRLPASEGSVQEPAWSPFISS